MTVVPPSVVAVALRATGRVSDSITSVILNEATTPFSLLLLLQPSD